MTDVHQIETEARKARLIQKQIWTNLYIMDEDVGDGRDPGRKALVLDMKEMQIVAQALRLYIESAKAWGLNV